MKDKKIVCDNCLSEACAKGEMFCEKYRTAGFKVIEALNERKQDEN